MTDGHPHLPGTHTPSDTMRMSVPALPARPGDGHKGTFGRVLVIGGSRGMSGAPALTGLAALRSGSGLVTLAVPDCIQTSVAAFEPCLMTIGLNTDACGGLDRPDETVLSGLLSGKNAVAIGPGLGQSAAAAELVRLVLQKSACPVVLDADALNLCAAHQLLAERTTGCSIVLTPHAGEFSRLCGEPVLTIQNNREPLAARFARQHAVIVVLKGPGTVVTDGHSTFINATGNSGMGTGGSGDVLTGMVASLIGQGMTPLHGAALAVHAHGLAGDLAAEKHTERGMIASDIVQCLPGAWRKLEAG